MGKVIPAAAERHCDALLAPAGNVNEMRLWQSRTRAATIADPLLHFEFAAQRDAIFEFVLWMPCDWLWGAHFTSRKPEQEFGVISAT
jgi:hypothetical protein